MPKLGFSPTVVGTGVAAVEAACSPGSLDERFELIIMDLQCVRMLACANALCAFALRHVLTRRVSRFRLRHTTACLRWMA
jgi:hypothetical protein